MVARQRCSNPTPTPRPGIGTLFGKEFVGGVKLRTWSAAILVPLREEKQLWGGDRGQGRQEGFVLL